MAKQRPSLKRPRITEEQVHEMMRMRRQGESIIAIAQAIGCHRQTVRTYLKEKRSDILADEARKEVLKGDLLGHFRELINFAQVGLKSRLDGSPEEQGKRIPKGVREPGPVFLEGVLGLPCLGSSTFMSNEWVRMYNPSPKDDYLMESLMEHTKDSPVWVYWNKWQRKVAGYEASSRELFDWLENRMETDLFDVIDLRQIRQMRLWLFGNILRRTINADAEELEIKGHQLVSSAAVARLPGETEVRLIAAQATNEASSKAFHKMAKSLGISGIRLHDLRHTHATLLLRQGVHPKVVSERLGHSSVAITLDIYSHVLPGIQAAAARRFDEGLQRTAEEVSPDRVG